MNSMLNQQGQMQLLSLAFLLAAAVSVYTAVQALLLVLSGYRRSLYGYYAAMSIVVALLFVVDNRLYRTETLAATAQLMQWRVALVLAFYPALFGFVAIYSGQKGYRRWLPLISLVGAGLIALNFTLPYSLRFNSLDNVEVQTMPWGEAFPVRHGTVSTWNIISRCLTTAVLLWALTRSAALYRRGARRGGILLGFALLGILAGSISSFLVDIGRFRFFYLGGMAYFGLIMFMNISLGMDLHAMNHELEKVSNKLRHEITLRERTEEYIRQIGFRDSLTGLPNRARLDEQLDRVLRQKSRQQARRADHDWPGRFQDH